MYLSKQTLRKSMQYYIIYKRKQIACVCATCKNSAYDNANYVAYKNKYKRLVVNTNLLHCTTNHREMNNSRFLVLIFLAAFANAMPQYNGYDQPEYEVLQEVSCYILNYIF